MRLLPCLLAACGAAWAGLKEGRFTYRTTLKGESLGAWGDVPALRFDYTICKREHVEEYTMYATNETPRYVLREDMPNGLVSELIRIEP